MKIRPSFANLIGGKSSRRSSGKRRRKSYCKKTIAVCSVNGKGKLVKSTCRRVRRKK